MTEKDEETDKLFNNYEINDQNPLATVQASTMFDVSFFYKREDEDAIEDTLKVMGFDGLASVFKSEEVDMESFCSMSDEMILSILQNSVTKGFIIKFINRYHKWKASNRVAPSSSSGNTTLEIKEGLVSRMLEGTDKGRTFLGKIDQSKPLSKSERKEMATIICAYLLEANKTLKKKEFYDIAVDISRAFPLEAADVYAGPTGDGTLYFKYNNELKSLRNQNLKPRNATKKRQASPSPRARTQPLLFSEQEMASNDFVKNNEARLDFDLLKQHWRKSSKIRSRYFQQSEEKSQLFILYPALTRPDGYQLILVDFEENYEQGLSFMVEWEKAKVKLLEILSRDVGPVEVEAEVELTGNQIVAQMVFDMHKFLYASKIYKHESSKYKPTISDTIKSFLFIHPAENALELESDKWFSTLGKYGIKKQAIIHGFGGDELSSIGDKFCVQIQEILYTFNGDNSLLRAIECLLKLYFVFDLSYPLLNCNVFEFMSKLYLGLPNATAKSKKGKVNELLSLLQ